MVNEELDQAQYILENTIYPINIISYVGGESFDLYHV